MGTIRIDAVWFQVYPDDHLPMHVHGFYGEVEVVIELLDNGAAVEAPRRNNPKPANAKRADVRKIIRVANANLAALKALWETHHG